jgi:glycosyltransferase involved in cell wall biosynthesis
MDSVKKVHPEWERHVLIVDEIRGLFDPSKEDFNVIEVGNLPIPEKKKFFFRYSVIELNTAVKPWLLEWLFKEKGYEQVVYFDPDIFVYRALGEMEKALEGGALMALTPHLTGLLNDDKRPTELDIVRAGSYNLGFIALARGKDLERFLKWWQEKLEFGSVNAPDRGMVFDQKWMDLAPGLFSGVSILRDEGYNVAYWNLNHRTVKKTAQGFLVNGKPLVFFHFSGLNPCSPGQLSKHQDRFRLADIGDAKELVEQYCKEVIGKGVETCAKWPYAFGHLSDGAPIIDTIRTYYRNHPHIQVELGDDPFRATAEYFNASWTKSSNNGPAVTRVLRSIWESRRDLQKHFPNIANGDQVALTHWFVNGGAADMNVPECFVAPIRKSLMATVIGPLAPPYATKKPGLALRLKLKLHPISRMLHPRTKRWIRKILKKIRPALYDNIFPGDNRAPDELHGEQSPAIQGLNIVGYLKAECGVGESSRICAKIVQAVGIPHSLCDVPPDPRIPCGDETLADLVTNCNSYPVNIIHVNADQTPHIFSLLGARFLQGRYNIGCWVWELPEFPNEWTASFNHVNEIWVPSTFVQKAIGEKAPIPVIRMPYAIDFAIPRNASRKDMELPEGKFLFLMMYDMHSYPARKNPEAAIEAFRKAFPNPTDVALVIKAMNTDSYPKEFESLGERLSGISGIRLITGTLPREQVYALESLCDAFVSLHRAEGFGLVLAEFMYLGKPVIATNWSGNTDFMNQENSCPVRYELTQIKEDLGPYHKGQTWAEPDIDHAAWHMRRLVNDADFRREIAEAGRRTITTEYSPQAVGKMYARRLSAITNILRERTSV